MLAYLENGEVYSWGNDPANEEVFKTPSLIDSLPKTVTEVACGSKHILALTSDGEVEIVILSSFILQSIVINFYSRKILFILGLCLGF